MEIVKLSLLTSHRVMSENKIQNDKLEFLVLVVFWMLFPENAHGNGAAFWILFPGFSDRLI